MSDLDLDRLGDVWRQQPDPAELAELQRSAEKMRRRARWAQRVDAAAALAVIAVVCVLVLRSRETDTVIIGGGAILILLLSHMRQRKLREAELKSLTGTSEEMLDQSIERARQSIKRARHGALTLVPAFLLGLLVAYAADQSVADLAAPAAGAPGLRKLILIIAGAAIAATAAHLTRSYRRSRRELERLVALRESYRTESETDTKQ